MEISTLKRETVSEVYDTQTSCRGWHQGSHSFQNIHGHHTASQSSIDQCKRLASKSDVFGYFEVKGTNKDRFAGSTKLALKTVQNFIKYNPHVGMNTYMYIYPYKYICLHKQSYIYI